MMAEQRKYQIQSQSKYSNKKHTKKVIIHIRATETAAAAVVTSSSSSSSTTTTKTTTTTNKVLVQEPHIYHQIKLHSWLCTFRIIKHRLFK
jgi:hypothetical protein